MRQVSINNNIVQILIDAGAKIPVCGVKQTKLWGLLDRLQPSQAKTHSYNSQPISVKGTVFCSVTYKIRTIPIEFFVLPGSCQPILDGFKTTQLKIITVDKKRHFIQSSENAKRIEGSFW